MDIKLKCTKCFRDVESSFLFCPYCGEPLSDLSKELKSKQDAVAQLKMLLFLIKKVEDEKTLNLLERLITKYKRDL